MILSELNKLILDVAGSNYLVNQAYVGDVYEINAKENRFGCFVATPMTANKNTAGTITYTYVMYYIDRLTKDESNIDLVQTDAMTVLTGLIGWLQDQSGALLDIGIDTTYTLFRQKFDDWCAGAWLQVSLVVPDSLCGDYDFNYIGGEIRPLYVEGNGTYTPAPGTGFGPVYVSVSGGGVTPEWVDNEIDLKLEGYATQSWVSNAIAGLAARSWVEDQGYLTSVSLMGYATEQWVSSQLFATQSWVTTAISGLAAMSWVSDQHFLTSASLTGYATESWVQAQGYLTSHQDLSSYATKSWATSEFFEESKVWTGTSAQWNQLTSSQKAAYTIALITE